MTELVVFERGRAAGGWSVREPDLPDPLVTGADAIAGAGVVSFADRWGSTRSRTVDREAVVRLVCAWRSTWIECSISESLISNSKAPGKGVARSNDSHAVRSRMIRRALTNSFYLRYGFLQITLRSACRFSSRTTLRARASASGSAAGSSTFSAWPPEARQINS